MLAGFFIPFFTILIAEFLDKSQLAVLLLASRTKKNIELLAGVMLAFLIVDGSAILFGSVITTLIPKEVVSIIAGVLFLFFGIQAFRTGNEDTEEVKKPVKSVFLTAFSMIFFSEWGDKTQLASAVFGTQYPLQYVLPSILLALFLLAIAAIIVGNQLEKRFERKTISRTAGVVFLLLGTLMLLSTVTGLDKL